MKELLGKNETLLSKIPAARPPRWIHQSISRNFLWKIRLKMEIKVILSHIDHQTYQLTINHCVFMAIDINRKVDIILLTIHYRQIILNKTPATPVLY